MARIVHHCLDELHVDRPWSVLFAP